ncbi:hypothetical protein LTR91_006857 [Friedmanniomyces endolithicus]|uniref:WLM domain-containing protein n=1 Tax=Friedmanniomyces endolithicus TaxID=329885 RepID=A0AAN6FPC1_9PEZI|nr:hypothetical protein LTS09_005254 [Friedmanniomyces endolithicus]KAK0269206.1 hypothetical protein LTR35_014914 [Friedmanniomyces endolithicus]KAK0285267.1 hypothetical protein LTS00_010896 [Friedmanniomyces endolithicus]KAK0309383.1 hypothetical protein LTR01_004490 [Friedmanniomyces endolithicus]KAK0321094.1 hypothetical protein LTR82_008011 [Friedmanniomyces endolithicus]
MVVPSYTDRDRDHNRKSKTAQGGPSGVQRSYASELRESEALFNSYEHLQGLQRGDAALKMLRQVASLVKPIMRKRGWTVQILAEFLPPEQNLLGLNINKGYKICLRLRYHNNPDLFLPTEQVVDTMLHELSHNVWGAHDSNFHRLWDELRDEHEILVRKGYTGEGFLSEGHRVGGGRHGVPSPHEMRRLARASAEKRSTQGSLGKGSGQRLGGAPIHQHGGDVRQVIADSVARRNTVDRGCASGRQDAAKLAEQASSNTFKTKAEEDDANDRAIAQALFELMEQEEERNITNSGFSTAPTDGGLAWSAKDGLYDPAKAAKPSPVSPHQPTEDDQLRWALHRSMSAAPNKDSTQSMSPVSPLTPAAGTIAQTIHAPTQPTPSHSEQAADDDLFEISSNVATHPTNIPDDGHEIKRQRTAQATNKRAQTHTPSLQSPAVEIDMSDPFNPDEWTCEVCTYINPTQYLACDACATERPQSAMAAASSGPGRSRGAGRPNAVAAATRNPRWAAPRPAAAQPERLGWNCGSCGAWMEHKWWTCSACGLMKSES